jgi:Rps23 Pro-64 3,4-dihydroxylase Tpa1-like proline 4-hydroxylase
MMLLFILVIAATNIVAIDSFDIDVVRRRGNGGAASWRRQQSTFRNFQYFSSSMTRRASSSTDYDTITNNDAADATSSGPSSSSYLSNHDIQRIAHGGVAIIPNFLPPHLTHALRNDAKQLFILNQFRPDGLTNTALRANTPEAQGFSVKADRQTFRGGAGWDDSTIGNGNARREFASLMDTLRCELAVGLNRPSLMKQNNNDTTNNQQQLQQQQPRHEMTYNWYEPGAKLGRHLDEHHEETKGVQGWLRPSRRSVTWLVYLNENWDSSEGGILRCFPRSEKQFFTETQHDNNNDDGGSNAVQQQQQQQQQVGAHNGNLQVGWIKDDITGYDHPVFLDCFRPSGGAALYRVVANNNNYDNNISLNEQQQQQQQQEHQTMIQVLSLMDFDVPTQPIEFRKFLLLEVQDKFEQISTSRLDKRFVTTNNPNSNNNFTTEDVVRQHQLNGNDDTIIDNDNNSGMTVVDILPTGGTLVLFDSVTLPHLVQEVTGSRQRIAATGWFHEDSQFVLEGIV